MTGADPPSEPCGSILDIVWLTETRIGAEFHCNPSLSEYVETDLASGKTVRDLLGLGFTPSPYRKYIAHVGPIVHFAAPIDPSYYLYLDKTVVSPLPRGVRPTEKEPNVVRRRGSTWIGVHEFVPKFFWSPDSERIAFVDCLFDWIEKGVAIDGATPIGDIVNRRCLVAVVACTGQGALFLPDKARCFQSVAPRQSMQTPSVLRGIAQPSFRPGLPVRRENSASQETEGAHSFLIMSAQALVDGTQSAASDQ
jgi:hypothetical protein